MNSIQIIIASMALVTTLCGGLFALYFKDKRHFIVGFSAGAVIGVALFDLLPEAFHFRGEQSTVFVAIGFLAYLLLDRIIGIHTHDTAMHETCAQHAIARPVAESMHLAHHEQAHHSHNKKHGNGGAIRAMLFFIHSLLDGVVIGVAFQVSTSVGVVVTVASLAHYFSDGINTIGAIIRSGFSKREALQWLIFVASAPVIGIVSASFVTVSDSVLGILISLFCGSFIYVGASDLIPESYHNHPTKWTTFATVLGMAVIYAAVTLAGGH